MTPVFFGLVALAIGGIGIAEPMQVLVNRRLPEAGVLKAIGLKGRQVMAMTRASHSERTTFSDD